MACSNSLVLGWHHANTPILVTAAPIHLAFRTRCFVEETAIDDSPPASDSHQSALDRCPVAVVQPTRGPHAFRPFLLATPARTMRTRTTSVSVPVFEPVSVPVSATVLETCTEPGTLRGAKPHFSGRFAAVRPNPDSSHESVHSASSLR